MISKLLTLMVLAVVAAAGAAYYFAGKYVTGPHWETGDAVIVGTTLTVEVDDWTYVAGGSVPLWFDKQGKAHDRSWPACLKSGTQTVKFAWVKAHVLDTDLRPIAAIDCRG